MKKQIKEDLVQIYKKLPEASAVPDIVWTAQKQLNRIEEIRQELHELQEDYTWNTIPRLINTILTIVNPTRHRA
jgi:hypothetical protein